MKLVTAHQMQEMDRLAIERYKIPSLQLMENAGRKTADIVLSHSFNLRMVPVDVHVWRVTRRLGLAPVDADYEQVKHVLEDSVPDVDKLFYDRAALRIGNEHCRKTAPRCGQ